MPVNPEPAATRQQLLEAASQIFAEVGFRQATIRQICQNAGANVAAVHYHFKDKEGLYAAVLVETGRASLQKYPVDMDLPPKASAEMRLHSFIHSFLLRIFSEGPIARHGKLMVREMVEPTAALDTLIEKNIRPMADGLQRIVQELLGKSMNRSLVRICSMSVVSQILFYHHSRPAIMRLFPDMKFGRDEIDALTDHIHQFSMAGIRQFAKKKQGRVGVANESLT